MTVALQLAPPAAPQLTPDECTLLAFVVWNLRVRDLPTPVADAAARVAAARRHTRPAGVDDLLVDAPYRVTAMPRREHEPCVDVSADQAGVPLAVHELLKLAPQYVVVTNLLAPAEAIT